MQHVRWANHATREALEALISQPETIHVPYMPHPSEPVQEFADRLCTVVAALLRAVDEFGLDGPIQAWLGRVNDWSAVEWDQVAALLAHGAKLAASPYPAERSAPVAA